MHTATPAKTGSGLLRSSVILEMNASGAAVQLRSQVWPDAEASVFNEG